MKIIVGLGNPGREYKNTRHNFGYLVVGGFAETLGGVFKKTPFSAETFQGICGDKKILLAKPLTFMNLSGEAVGRLLGFYKKRADSLLVVHDDLDLPLGRIKFASGGSSGGHKGVESVIEAVNTKSFDRLRMGIGRAKGTDPVEYVLDPFAKNETPMVDEVVSRAVEALKVCLTEGLVRAMEKFNRKE